MQGDFTRGHRPDGKRGQRFTRGLMQQRRLLLDSDVNALVEALHERLRDLASDLGCPKGSPDLGFLVTPGPLLAIFETLTDVVIDENNVTVYRDYSRKFLERFPSVFIAADQGVAGVATLRLRAAADSNVRFWCRSEVATTVALPGGVVLNIPAGASFQAVDVNLAGPLEEIQIDLQAGEQMWIALIEQLKAAGTDPQFSVAAGRFYLDGLPLANAADGLHPAVSFPLDPAALLTGPAPPALANGDRVIAFLEGWERHITAVEDPGLLERALGGGIDTTTRGQAVGQVKLVRPLAGPIDAKALARAICDPLLPTGTLEVTTPPAPPDPDPCALPLEDGYTGPDNRFYRFEVHQGEGLGNAIFKWSRDNASELFPAISAPAANRLIFASDTALRAGDLVEVLNEAVDLGDQAAAAFDVGDEFQRPERAVGPLAILEAASGPPPANGVAFVLRQVSGVGDVNLDLDIFGPFPGGPAIKVRRWHGLIETQAGTTAYTLEHGIEIELSGEFAAGDYWQYEARVLGENANGPFPTSPHGPLRAFAPLALLRFEGAGQPLVLEQWLDDRFSPLCELNADDIAFEGERVQSDSATVQEALEELLGRESEIIEASCGELIARIENSLQNVFDTIPDGGDAKVCVQPGVRNLPALVVVANKGHLIVTGTGEGVRLVRAGSTVLSFTGCRHVEIRDLRIEGSLLFVNCEEVVIEGVSVIQTGVMSQAIRITSPESTAVAGVQARLYRNKVQVGFQGDGIFVLNAERVDIEDNDIEVNVGPFNLMDLLAQETGPAAIGNVIMDRVYLDLPPGVNDDIFLGGSTVEFGPPVPGGRLHIITARGRDFNFTTHRLLSAEIWDTVLETNPINLGNSAPDNSWFAALRRLRKRLAQEMFGIATPATIPDSAVGAFSALALAIGRSALQTWGHAGITVAATRAQSIPFGDHAGGLGGIFNRTPNVRITNNRIGGFTQGVHVGASDWHRKRSAHIVHVEGNMIALRVPLFAYERHGIFVGSASTARVRENVVEVISPGQTDWRDSLPPIDGIRLWGEFGPLIHVKDNLSYGVTTGVRLRNLRSRPANAVHVRTVADNGYFYSPASEGTPLS